LKNDIEVKENIYKLFWLWGFCPFYEINLYHDIGISKSKQQITDIDVLGIKFTEHLFIDKIVAECKTGKESPIYISMWLRGLMDYFNASKGFVVAGRSVSEEHKLATTNISVRLLSYEELTNFLKVYNLKPLEKFNFYRYDLFNEFFRKAFNSESMFRIREIVYYKFWAWPDNMKLRFILGEMRKISKYLDGSSKYHQALVAELFTLVGIAFQIMLSHFFPLYLSPEDKSFLGDRLKFYLYGGKETYDYLNALYREIKMVKIEDTLFKEEKNQGLTLPSWNNFIQLFKTFLENPTSCLFLPHLFRILAFEKILANNSNYHIQEILPQVNNITVKLASDVVDYINSIVNYPKEISNIIKTALHEFIS